MGYQPYLYLWQYAAIFIYIKYLYFVFCQFIYINIYIYGSNVYYVIFLQTLFASLELSSPIAKAAKIISESELAIVRAACDRLKPDTDNGSSVE